MKAWDYRIKNGVVKLKTITKLGVLSIAKMQAVITGLLNLFISVVATVLARVSPDVVENAGLPVGGMGIITSTLAGLIVGFIVGALIAAIYNLISPSVGGIQVELK